MDQTSLELLEFPKVREILASFTSFSASQELAHNLMPSAEPQLVSLLLTQSAEARRLLALNPGGSIGRIVDFRAEAEMANRGKILATSTLVTIKDSLQEIRSLRAVIGKLKDKLPALWDIASGIMDLSHLETEIGRCLTPTGEILDSASEKLSSLRQQLKRTREELLGRLDSIIKSRHSQRFLQEPLIMMRHDRYVVPVKAELRKEIKGIVHDISNTGATVFVEPLATLEIGNQLREVALDEEQEVERILRDLSSQVGIHCAEISRNVALAAEIDLALAKARYAEKVNATEPIIVATGEDRPDAITKTNRLHLTGARHPLLEEKAVPLSIEIGNDFSILIISGPNTGGKTVALKTVGLLTLMAQAGIPIPAAPESCIPVFDGIFADIGDEQSIAHMLSTFSWHMGNIVRIIRDSTRNSLVLLDELGTSTDPVEGVALAQAILLNLLSNGNLVVATTHYSGLKVFAHQTAGLKNASLDFDPLTLRPTYHLTMGVPGGSNALSMASQLGMEPEIIATAKNFMSEGHLEMESLLSGLGEEKRRVEELRSSLESDRSKIDGLREELESELHRLKVEERNTLRQIKDDLLQEAALLEKDIREAIKGIQKAKTKTNIERAKKVLAGVHKDLESQAWQTQSSRPVMEETSAIAVGDRVRLIDTGLEGVVLSVLENSHALEIQAGDIKLKMKSAGVEKVSPLRAAAAFPSSGVKTSSEKKRSSLELDLRGKRADEVEPKLDIYLNDAFVSGLSQVRIIHGFGTGTVRQIVHDFIRRHPLVKSFGQAGKEEGGGGVTIVKLQGSSRYGVD
ncbi:MAG: endonuclease MutS2 [Dehalococcoidia bacterium]|nr:endonuclease MutS2 [Dehalococcoidia bacterium]